MRQLELVPEDIRLLLTQNYLRVVDDCIFEDDELYINLPDWPIRIFVKAQLPDDDKLILIITRILNN